MAVNTTLNYIDTIITLRKDTAANYNVVGGTWVPQDGEVCIVDDSGVLRFKVGDGTKTYNQLTFLDDNAGIIYFGYYFNGNFYADSTYTEELPKSTAHLYVDKNSSTKGQMYTYDGSQYNRCIPDASDSIAGIMKLYQSGGLNTDGTISQKGITQGVQSISFIADPDDDECLTLDLPWD